MAREIVPVSDSYRVETGPDRANSSRWPTGWGGPGLPSPWRRSAPGRSSTLPCPAVLCANAETILDGLDTGQTWEAVIAAEPSLGVNLSAVRSSTGRCWPSPTSSTSSRRTRSVMPERYQSWPSGPGQRSGSRTGELTILRRAGLVHDLGRLGVSNAIWDKRGPLGVGEWERVRMHPYLTERMLCQSDALAPLGGHRRPAPRAARRLRLPPRAPGGSHLRTGQDPGGSRRLSVDARASASPTGAPGSGCGRRAPLGSEGRADGP